MYNLLDQIREILHYLKQYKARTAMTMFGIIWGTMTVILLLSFGAGVKKQMSKNMHGIGTGIAIVWPGRTSMPFEGYGRDRRIRLNEDDMELLRSEVKNITRISPEFSKWGSAVRVADKINRPNVTGIIPEYGVMRNVRPEPGGRWLNDLDIKDKRRVVFIGNRLRDFLFGENANVIGKYVYIDQTPFLVVGVMKEKTQNSSYNQRDRDRAFIPMTTFKSIFGYNYVSNFVYQISDPRLSEQVQKQVYATLGKKFKFDPNDTETLGIWDTNEFEEFIFYFTLGFNLFMGLIGVITLIVGGIGLANIMYVVVQERTREIGIRRATGARRKTILGQFVFEAFVIIGIGAFIGFVIAVLIITGFNALPLDDFKEAVGSPELNLLVAFVTIIILGAIGFLAGYFPARRASRLNVVDALRH
ncbi:MAG: FtsX-like permease family protein [Calditrichaeota bacterium]|nr:MAG: ABC transporter permease [Calditrichota bacterium]MBL1207544.1 FtsX-like permease family protein [Calditrichota bacterium]NOG47376.1 FtsX-like permease family protein [Calditrichota bacterium]